VYHQGWLWRAIPSFLPMPEGRGFQKGNLLKESQVRWTPFEQARREAVEAGFASAPAPEAARPGAAAATSRPRRHGALLLVRASGVPWGSTVTAVGGWELRAVSGLCRLPQTVRQRERPTG
jgi:hypothetical protein